MTTSQYVNQQRDMLTPSDIAVRRVLFRQMLDRYASSCDLLAHDYIGMKLHVDTYAKGNPSWLFTACRNAEHDEDYLRVKAYMGLFSALGIEGEYNFYKGLQGGLEGLKVINPSR